MHIFPQLRKAEQKYADELVVIGVHSAKFDRERLTESIRDAAARYGLEHPIFNDRDFVVWQSYAVRAWPTLMFIDPNGKVIGSHSGELPFPALDQVLSQMVEEFDRANLLNRQTLPFTVRHPKMDSPLAFPGKVLADATSRRLFIADSNHHRLVITDLEGHVQNVVGRGTAGAADGAFELAAFNWPQGMAIAGDQLYVADTENHLIRRVDLATRRVETIAGTGEQARGQLGPGVGRSAPLNSPWDLVLLNDWLYIAMAGSHQVFALNPDTGELHPHAGSGAEGIQDASLLDAWLAQPCGITTDGKRLYIADSESSAVRWIDVDPAGHVGTIVGTDLFEFGDRDGSGDSVLLQHPLGVELHDGLLVVADTYNNKLKQLDIATRTATSWIGTGERGHADGPVASATFDEPSGTSFADGRLYVADTNNHAIRVVDLASGQLSTLELKGL